jgi:enterochelin esterase-like enzyme
MSRFSLVDGPFPVVVSMLAVAGMLWLLGGGRRFWRLAVPLGLAGGAAGAVMLWYLAEQLYGWWDESFPRVLYIWGGATVAAVLLLIPRLVAGPGLVRRLATGLAVLLVAFGAVVQANAQYAAFPTVASMFADQDLTAGPITAVTGGQRSAAAKVPATTEARWDPPSNLPAHGSVYNVAIPGTVSGYHADKAYVYLPPAYLADPRGTNLPVLVMIHGRPGGPGSWISSGNLAQTMDGYASRHRGLAPVVIMPDLSMGASAWPLCLDSKVARSATYLAVDVPAWARTTLGAGTAGSRQWAIGGLSSGGTCSMQLAANYPQIYPTFLDMSGETEPTIHGGRKQLIHDYFGGSAASFTKQNAMDVLAARKFPGTAGRFLVGASDTKYGQQMVPVLAAARASGMQVRLQKVPGGHNWHLWSAALPGQLPWLMQRLGLATGGR